MDTQTLVQIQGLDNCPAPPRPKKAHIWLSPEFHLEMLNKRNMSHILLDCNIHQTLAHPYIINFNVHEIKSF